MSNEFIKADSEKIQFGLVEPSFIKGIAEVLTVGANKYEKDNWKLCDDERRYIDALLRHINAYQAGEYLDAETGLSHLYHAGANLMFISYFDEALVALVEEYYTQSLFEDADSQ